MDPPPRTALAAARIELAALVLEGGRATDVEAGTDQIEDHVEGPGHRDGDRRYAGITPLRHVGRPGETERAHEIGDVSRDGRGVVDAPGGVVPEGAVEGGREARAVTGRVDDHVRPEERVAHLDDPHHEEDQQRDHDTHLRQGLAAVTMRRPPWRRAATVGARPTLERLHGETSEFASAVI